MKTVEEITEELQTARREMIKAKVLYRRNEATYDDMAAAAKKVAALTFDWQKAKFPNRRPVRVSYQSLLR